MRRALVSIAVGAALASAGAHAAGDAARGAELHQACVGCHGTELYAPGRAKVKSMAALRKEVVKWNDRMNPKFSKKEVDDLVAYLNRDFYKLTR